MKLKRSQMGLIPVLLLLLALFASGKPAFAALDRSVFELDGGAMNGAASGEDWEDIYKSTLNPPTGTSTAVAKTFKADGANPPQDTSYFTGGGSKDDLDVSNWRHTTSDQAPDKDEITNAYAAAYRPNGELQVYFGLDRYANNGDAQVGFWLFHNKVSMNADGTFSGVHQAKTATQRGDILILSDFTNGGSVSTVKVYEWVGTGGDVTATGTLRLLEESAQCSTSGTTSANECGIANTGGQAAPWPYTPKNGTSGTFPKGSFYEGGVNLTQLLGGDAGCFATFMAETRSSQQADAQLKDFALGQFPLCDASLEIQGNGVNEVGDWHDFTVTARQTTSNGDGVATDGHVDVNLSANPAATINIDAASSTCDDAGDNLNEQGQCIVRFKSDTATTVTGYATATLNVANTTFNVDTRENANLSLRTATKHFVDASISIVESAVNEVRNQHVFTITVTAHPAGATPVSFGAITPSVSPDPTSKSTTCASPTGTGNTRTCTLTINNNTTGTFTANAAADVTMGGVTVTRSTSGNSGPGGSGPAVKKFVDASISISPNGLNSVGDQHIFTITVTAHPGTATPVSFGAITPSVSPTPGTQSNTCASPSGTGNTRTCTLTINSNTAGTFTANASATVTMGGVQVSRSTAAGANSGPDGSGPATKVYQAGSIQLTKTVELGPLTDAPRVCFTLTRTDGGSMISTTPDENTNAAGLQQCYQYGGENGSSHLFKWEGLATGTYALSESVTPSPPYSPIADITGILVNATSTDSASRFVNLGTKNNPLPPGDLRIRKNLNGELYEGTTLFTFRVYSCGASATCASLDQSTETDLVATRQIGGDNPNPATVNNLDEGYYLVHENVPAGYSLSPDQQDQIVAVYAGNHANPAQAASLVTFNNEQLFKMIVLTCNTATEELVVSEVKMDRNGDGDTGDAGETLDTVAIAPDGITDAGLCGLDGANYDNLKEGTYRPVVTLPKAGSPS